MKHISKSMLDEIKKHLEKEQANIESSLSNLDRDDPFSNLDRVNDNASSETDAFEESEHVRIEAQQKELHDQLTTVKQTLNKIDDGRYGICDSCGKTIEPDRLRALPTANVCMDCEHTRS